MIHYVISDLHLNMGRLDTGELHPLEDFDSDDAFDRLVDQANAERASLVINGDWLDFLQLDPMTGIEPRQSIGGIPLAYTAREALLKLETCLRTQARHFSTLTRYLAGGGRLTIVQGNHDADLFFPKRSGELLPPLQKRLRDVLKPPSADALCFVDTSLRLGSVHVEHGHQRCDPFNEFQGHPEIFHSDRAAPLTGASRLELLWGSRFVLEFFNGLEREFPFADNLKPMSRALWLGLKNKWIRGKHAAQVVAFLWDTGVPAKAVTEVLAPDVDARELVQRLPDDGIRTVLLERMSDDPMFAGELIEELNTLKRDALPPQRLGERAHMGREEVVAMGDATRTLGIVRDPRELREARRLLDLPGVTAVVFGHTHHEIDGHADEPLRGYFNTGTWTPRLDLRKPEIRTRLRNADFPLELLKDRTLFELRLLYAEIVEEPAGTRVRLIEHH